MDIQVINTVKMRNIRECTFGWIDHKLLHCGFLERLSVESILLYFFLCLVSDKRGISYYGYQKICKLLKMKVPIYTKARQELICNSLIACRESLVQVLKVPVPALEKKPEVNPDEKRNNTVLSLKQILEQCS